MEHVKLISWKAQPPGIYKVVYFGIRISATQDIFSEELDLMPQLIIASLSPATATLTILLYLLFSMNITVAKFLKLISYVYWLCLHKRI
jgi:hypothetical protein